VYLHLEIVLENEFNCESELLFLDLIDTRFKIRRGVAKILAKIRWEGWGTMLFGQNQKGLH
jgi:hypothetical protein